MLLVIIQPSYPGGMTFTKVGRQPSGCGVEVLRRGRGGDTCSHNSSDPRAQQSITINPSSLINAYAICIIHTIVVILFNGGVPFSTFCVQRSTRIFFSSSRGGRSMSGAYHRTIITLVQRKLIIVHGLGPVLRTTLVNPSPSHYYASIYNRLIFPGFVFRTVS